MVSEEEDILRDRNVSIPESKLLELYQILYTENLFGLLSEFNQTAGTKMIESIYDIKVPNIKDLGLRFTVTDHMTMANELLEISEKQSSFWKIVVKLVYAMMSIEKNPLLSEELDDIKELMK